MARTSARPSSRTFGEISESIVSGMRKLLLYFWQILRKNLSVQDTRERAIEAFRILNDFVGDLIGATKGMEYFDAPQFKAGASSQVTRIFNKMAMSFLFITLAKWIEFFDRYEKVIPSGSVSTCRDLRNELDARGVREFRNKIVGHIWSRKHSRPLLPQEIEALETRITKGSYESFFKWVNDPTKNALGLTVVGTSEAVRDEISKKWGLSKSELFPWNP